MQKIRLNNPCMVKRLLNRTINQLLSDDITSDKGRAIGYLCSILLKATEIEELEARMVAIEQGMEERRAGR